MVVVCVVLLTVPIGATSAAPTAADTNAVLANNVLHSISVLTPTHLTDPNRVIGLGIGLQGGNPSGETAYISGECDPTSPLYQQFLDPDQYEQNFGVPQSRVDAAVAWLRGDGLSVQTIPGVSEYIVASGTVAKVQSRFGISIADYHIDAGDFYANTTAPTVPVSLGVIGIAGLNNLEGPRFSRRTSPGAPGPAAPSPSLDTGLTAPRDLWSIYEPAGRQQGRGPVDGDLRLGDHEQHPQRPPSVRSREQASGHTAAHHLLRHRAGDHPQQRRDRMEPRYPGFDRHGTYFNDATANAPASRAFEYSWNYTGGGDSKFIAAGGYQNTDPAILVTHCATDPHGKLYPVPGPLCRGIPDVAAQSGDITGNGYKITSGGKNDQSGGGTSRSSPLWLGMWTRIQAAAKSRKGNGFADPAIYRLGSDSSRYAKDFFDIGGASTATAPNCNGPNPATNCSRPGWDYNSGWGTPEVTNLMLDLDGRTTPSHPTTPNPVPIIVPVISGTTCPGPQVLDAVGDAPNDYPGGDGSNMDNLDIVNASFASPDANTLRVTLKIKDLQPPPPPANLPSALWRVYWTYNGTLNVAEASSTGAAVAGLFVFDAGPSGSTTTVPGTAHLGPNGTLVWNIPLSAIGSPLAGASLSHPFAETHGSFMVLGHGLHYTAAADRAPDLGFGAPRVIGQTC